MHHHLGEGDLDALGIEGQFHLLVEVEPDTPVIARLDPGTHHDIDRGVGQCSDGDDGFRVFQDARVLVHQSLQDLLGLAQVGAVADAEGHVDPAGIHARVVDDGAVEDGGVRHHHHLVVTGSEGGGEQLDGLHHAIGAGHLDEFTGLDGAEDDQQETGGEVGERTLQRQTDGQTGSTDNGNEGGGLDSDPAQGGDHYEHQDGVLEDAADEVGDCGIQLAGLHHLDHGTADEVGGDVTDQQGEQGGGDVDRVLDDQPLVVDQPGLRFGNDLGFHRMSC